MDRSLTMLTGSDRSFALEEHESGPEILLYLAVTTAGGWSRERGRCDASLVIFKRAGFNLSVLSQPLTDHPQPGGGNDVWKEHRYGAIQRSQRSLQRTQ